jgi:hypothetical protein
MPKASLHVDDDGCRRVDLADLLHRERDHHQRAI